MKVALRSDHRFASAGLEGVCWTPRSSLGSQLMQIACFGTSWTPWTDRAEPLTGKTHLSARPGSASAAGSDMHSESWCSAELSSADEHSKSSSSSSSSSSRGAAGLSHRWLCRLHDMLERLMQGNPAAEHVKLRLILLLSALRGQGSLTPLASTPADEATVLQPRCACVL